MKYTMRNGKERATLWLPVELTREEISRAKEIAKERGEHWHTMLAGWAALGVEGDLYSNWELPEENN